MVASGRNGQLSPRTAGLPTPPPPEKGSRIGSQETRLSGEGPARPVFRTWRQSPPRCLARCPGCPFPGSQCPRLRLTRPGPGEHLRSPPLQKIGHGLLASENVHLADAAADEVELVRPKGVVTVHVRSFNTVRTRSCSLPQVVITLRMGSNKRLWSA